MVLFTISIVLALFFLFCLIFLLTVYWKSRGIPSPHQQLTIMLGSGGHTGQMCEMLRGIQFDRINKVNIILTGNDRSSQIYYKGFIKAFIPKNEDLLSKTHFYRTKRTNQVKQSPTTAIVSTIVASIHSLRLVFAHLMMTTAFIANGPGTCAPFFIIFWLINRCRRITRATPIHIKLIFVQSWCRVTSISLTGKIVRYVVDNFIVHWEQLQKKYPFAKYYGKLI